MALEAEDAKMAMEAGDANSDAANFKAQANAAFRSHQDWGQTDLTDLSDVLGALQ